MRTDPFASLSGQVAIITGSTSGIGLGLAEVLAARGVHLVLNGLGDRAEIEKTRLGLQVRYGVKVLYHDANMLKADEIEALIAYAKTELGGLDILVNNAGIQHVEAIDSFPVADWDRIIGINLSSVFHTTRAALPIMKAKGRGRIVNIASRAAYRGDSPAHWHYAASKGGMVAMTKTIARGYAAQGILAFAVCPGFTMTGMADDYLASRGGDKLLADIPLGRVASPEEVAATVRFLCTDAPPSMTGAVLDVNGASYVR